MKKLVLLACAKHVQHYSTAVKAIYPKKRQTVKVKEQLFLTCHPYKYYPLCGLNVDNYC
jgi:hypothetical protein